MTKKDTYMIYIYDKLRMYMQQKYMENEIVKRKHQTSSEPTKIQFGLLPFVWNNI